MDENMLLSILASPGFIIGLSVIAGGVFTRYFLKWMANAAQKEKIINHVDKVVRDSMASKVFLFGALTFAIAVIGFSAYYGKQYILLIISVVLLGGFEVYAIYKYSWIVKYDDEKFFYRRFFAKNAEIHYGSILKIEKRGQYTRIYTRERFYEFGASHMVGVEKFLALVNEKAINAVHTDFENTST